MVIDSHATDTQDIQKKYIRYSEKIANNISSFSNQGLPLKTDRLSNNSGNIVLIYDELLSDSIKTSLLAAKKLWESKLPTVQPIFISVLFEPLGNGVAMAADVAYSETPNFVGCPCALASQLSNFPFGSVDSPDGYIILNSSIPWNCKFSKESASEYNLPTMVLRGIARCLGFGSSVIEESKNRFFYTFGWPTYFDNLLYSGNKSLYNLSQGSLEMANFVKSDKVYAKSKLQNPKIYAPNEFIQDLSLCYFDDKNSLMSYSMGQGNINLSIDDKTSDILRTIGWNLPKKGLTIKCDNISNDGIGSSYETHTFSLLKEDENVSDYNWRFLLKDKVGNFIQVSNGTTDIFSISEISSIDNYFVNINGDLEGRVECDYTLNGQRYNANPFILSLELKPIIQSIDDIIIVYEDQYEFSLKFNVSYVGADYVSVEIEEEYNSTLRNYRFDEPYIAHIKTGDITNLYYSWITVIVSNKYGSVYETLEYAPAYGSRDSKDIPACAISDVSLNDVCQIIIYNFDGSLIFKGSPTEFSYKSFIPGIYLKKEIFTNGLSKISKILFK